MDGHRHRQWSNGLADRRLDDRIDCRIFRRCRSGSFQCLGTRHRSGHDRLASYLDGFAWPGNGDEGQKHGQCHSRGAAGIVSIAIAIALTVLREGSEAALFLQGMLANTAGGTGGILLGGALGLCAGAAIGAIAYFGLLRIPLSRFFSVTGTLLLLLAAGLAGQMAKFLIQADWLPALANPLWDTSWFVPVQSWMGSALHMLLGYEDRPSGMQVIFYFTALISISAGASWAHRHSPSLTHKLKSA